MNKTLLEFDNNPSILPTLYKALVLPRQGVSADDSFPEIAGKLKNIKTDIKNLEDYCKLCKIEKSETLPPLYPHVIAGSLMMHILTDSTFPIKLLGAVHKYNTINYLKPIKVTDSLNVTSSLGQPRYYKKGLEFDVITEVEVSGSVHWTETSTFYVKKYFKTIEQEADSSGYLTQTECEKLVTSWKLSSFAGKKYALICKDFNPIHISNPLAKLFGFKKDLVHGMCSAAQSLAQSGLQDFENKTLKMYFKGPSYMGSTLYLKTTNDETNRFDLFCGKNDRPVISMEVI